MSRLQLLLSLLAFAASHTGLIAQAPRASAQPVHPLEQVLVRVREAKARGQYPIVVFDLDDTLFRVSFRTRKILRDWSNLHPHQLGLREKIEALDPLKMPWSLPATLDMAGITDPALRKSADRWWGKWFFGSDYLTVDRTIPGAVLYVNRLARSGAHIVYLTGRDTERMFAGTVAALRKAGFPKVGPHAAKLIMKPDWKVKDYVFKTEACKEINAMGPVVASIDNEPRNCNIFKAAFPGALIVCLDTPHSDKAPPLEPGIPVVKDYRF